MFPYVPFIFFVQVPLSGTGLEQSNKHLVLEANIKNQRYKVSGMPRGETGGHQRDCSRRDQENAPLWPGNLTQQPEILVLRRGTEATLSDQVPITNSRRHIESERGNCARHEVDGTYDRRNLNIESNDRIKAGRALPG